MAKLIKIEDRALNQLMDPEMCELLKQGQSMMLEIQAGIKIRTKSSRSEREWLKIPKNGAMITAREALNELKA